MSEQFYNPFEDTDVNIPVFNKEGKSNVIPFFICGVKIKHLNSKSGDSLTLAELELQVHESIEKIPTIQLFHEDENGRYNYRAPSEEVSSSIFIGKRVKSGRRVNLWRNNTKGSGKMNKLFIEQLRVMGVEIKTKKIEHEGKKVDVFILPELNEQLLLGLPVFGWMDIDSYTSKNGNNIQTTVVNKVAAIPSVERVTVLENTLVDVSNNAAAVPNENNPFSDVDGDLPF